MRQAVMKLATHAYMAWLSSKLEPSGKSFVIDLEARCNVVIDAITEANPQIPVNVTALNEEGLVLAVDTVLKALSNAYTGESWAQLVCHVLRYQIKQVAGEILPLLVEPQPHP